ncbi:DMT family transporter [Rufibacter psychrotolerans]|uniref:DMT family transporter n=1 Tax=Rufibacter psychrotolerans TaxID=2812556 RepID=UPI001967D434|nr:DMT family transporter [Rufibacter sp. SYSU D00308]
MKFKGYSLAIISATFYGLLPLFILPIKQADYPLSAFLFGRFLLSALIVLGILVYKKINLSVSGRELAVLVALGTLYALSTDFLMLGYEYVSPGVASTILYAFPVMVALLMSTLFRERMGKSTICSLMITSVGIVVLGLKGSSLEVNVPGVTVSLLSAFFYALYIVLVNKSGIRVSELKLTFYSLVFSAVYFGVKGLVLQDPFSMPNPVVFSNLVLLSLVSTAFSILALVYAIKLIGSTSTSIMGAFEPIVAVCVSVVVFGEHMTLNLAVGVLLIIMGVIQNILTDSRLDVA